MQNLGMFSGCKNLIFSKSFTGKLDSYKGYVSSKFQHNLILFTEVIAPKPLKRVQFGPESKKMRGFFRVKSRTANSQTLKLSSHKLWVDGPKKGYVGIYVDPLTWSQGTI